MRSNKVVLAPSILAANFLNLEKDINLIEQSSAEWLHIDIMDGNFVPNISFGPGITKAMKSVSSKVFDVHLMINQPDAYINAFRDAGADYITVHYEACPHLHRTIQMIKSTGAKAGVAINPHTDIGLLADVLEDLDLVLVMSVNPGFGGQKFIYRSLDKISRLKKIITERNLNTLISIDGGVGLQNAEAIISAGADVLVAGSSILKSDKPSETIKRFQDICQTQTWI